jgi:hypothetical protein
VRDGIVLGFETNTLAFMTASLEQCCKKLRNDTPEAQKAYRRQTEGMRSERPR